MLHLKNNIWGGGVRGLSECSVQVWTKVAALGLNGSGLICPFEKLKITTVLTDIITSVVICNCFFLIYFLVLRNTFHDFFSLLLSSLFEVLLIAIPPP